jgi:hypothetical protein
MDRALLGRVLQGDEEAIARFGESDHCAVIDWRDGLPGIVQAVAPFLPEDYLRLEEPAGLQPRLVAGGRPPQEVPAAANRQEDLISAVNRALLPEFELHRFRPIDGDGYSLFVAPADLWAELERSSPDATERYFLGAERLAAYWRKGFFARLLTKP